MCTPRSPKSDMHACVGCTFANLGGSGGGGMDGAPVEVSGGSADFVNCAFLNNAVADGSRGVVLGRGGASVALRGCTFAGNAGHLLQVGADTEVEEAARGASEAAPPATFFSDDPSVSVCQLPGGFEDPSGIAESDTGRRQMQAALVRMGQVRIQTRLSAAKFPESHRCRAEHSCMLPQADRILACHW